MLRISFSAILFTFSTFLFSQVEKRVVIEHFTNTRCGICATKNPGFYGVLSNHPDAIHLSIHPSSPYNTCVFNLQNVTEDDARTNFYGIYGGTPRLVIQGEVLGASTDLSNATRISSYEGDSSAFDMWIRQEYPGTVDSIKVSVGIIKVSESALSEARLFSALAQSVVDYEAPNGENSHFDVFLNSLFGDDGQTVALPLNMNDTLIYSATMAINQDWDIGALYAMAILQDTDDKSVIQGASAEGEVILSAKAPVNAPALVFPNPFQDELTVSGDGPFNFTLRNSMGATVFYNSFTERQSISLELLPNGMHHYDISDALGSRKGRLVKIAR